MGIMCMFETNMLDQFNLADIYLVEAYLGEQIDHSGDDDWKGLVTHQSYVQYGVLGNGQCILNVG